MKQMLLLLLTTFTIFSCKEQASKFYSDGTKYNFQTKYFYKYESNKIISKTEIMYTYFLGNITDTMTFMTYYEYNNKGLLFKEVSKSDNGNIFDTRIYEYNSMDSVIRDITITPEGDTTFWTEFKYFPDGKKETFDRNIFTKIDTTIDFSVAINSRTYDTMQRKNEYSYENGICHSLKLFDKNNKLEYNLIYDYKNNLLDKETFYDKNNKMSKTNSYFYDNTNKLSKVIYNYYLDSLKFIDRIKFYNYSKSNIHPDFYSINSINDTVDICTNSFKNNELVTKIEVLEKGEINNKIYYKNGKEVTRISIDGKSKVIREESYSYYDNGDIKEEVSSQYKINAH